ncbi:unnamed protein product [Spirodela intermedia]|uniref:Uncharacterized protein n=2 Tax=Spirodela intermedia TaxID=51605 RepID=A0A7I8LIZ8_SPIIN|nr:unnamed protein product [Spirodela intermedia]CAA6672552.1 unnamed protein product [Spirodela intermedia]CAA7409822.1 unnamed protein product [Spirodela intermedia]
MSRTLTGFVGWSLFSAAPTSLS